jgi:transcriptional regulator with XRE-family HTH domain
MAETGSSMVAAEKIRHALHEKRLSQRALARRTGMSVQRLHRRMKGETPFRLEELTEVAEVLEMPVSALMGEEETG